MIEDLDETIRQLLIQKGGLDPSEIDVAFEVPDREWSASIVKPTLNFYLYDVRENLQLRETYFEEARQANGRITKYKAPRRIDCSYLLTAWTSAVEDEHRLLSSTLLTLFRFPSFPNDILQGTLVEQERPIPTSIGQPDGVLKKSSRCLDSAGQPAQTGAQFCCYTCSRSQRAYPRHSASNCAIYPDRFTAIWTARVQGSINSTGGRIRRNTVGRKRRVGHTRQ